MNFEMTELGKSGKVDNSSDIALSKFGTYDEYGFERPEDFDAKAYENFMSSYLPVLVRRTKRWETLLDGSNSAESLRKNRTLKRFVRKGVPAKHRHEVWMLVSGAKDMKKSNPDHFNLMKSSNLVDAQTLEQINSDILRTFPNNVYFSDSNDSKSLLQPLFNVLYAFANSEPNIGYCQGMNYVVGLLLIVTRNEEDAFWLFKCLIDKILPEYYGKHLKGLLTDTKVLAELMRTKSPEVHRKIELFNVPWALLCSKWFVCLYGDVLPIETVFRVWDCLFYEGSKILLRVAIALIKMNEQKVLLKANNFAELLGIFKESIASKELVECHEFINAMFTLSNPLASSEIQRLRLQFEEEVKAEIDQRQKRIDERKTSTAPTN